MLTKMAEGKHGEAIRPLGGGGARLPNGRGRGNSIRIEMLCGGLDLLPPSMRSRDQ